MSNIVKLAVFVPETHADRVRDAMSHTGAGVLGKYTNCSFSVKGIGRFKAGEGTSPTVGTVGEPESVAEERIEVVCEKGKLKSVIEAIKKAHPYEEVPIDVYPLLDLT